MNERLRVSFSRVAAGVIAALLLSPPVPADAGALSGPDEIGQWSAPMKMPTIGIHAILLRTGEVMLFGYPHHKTDRFHISLWDPETNEFDDFEVPRKRDAFCSGHTVLPSGKVFIAGGTGHDDPEFWGARATDVFNPITRTWKKGPSMDVRRWYPTTIGTPDGKVLIFSGHRFPDDVEENANVRRVEEFDPATGKMTTLPNSASRYLPLYPRMHVVPSGQMLFSGPAGKARFFDPTTRTWSLTDEMNQPIRHNGTSVLLPGLDRVMALGGRQGTEITSSAEIIDFGAPVPEWQPTASMTYRRMHANPVLLPDGKLMMVGGGQDGPYGQPIDWPELFDPDAGTWTTLAPQGTARSYHSTALLLPDGRVLSSGQDIGPTKKTFQIYSPPYLFAGSRPKIVGAPTHISYGEGFEVDLESATAVDRVALIKAGSVTHSVNFDQRYVDLDFTASSDTELDLTAPPNSNEAPAGWYMLFVTNDDGVPSEAKWVKVEA